MDVWLRYHGVSVASAVGVATIVCVVCVDVVWIMAGYNAT